jgi:hypothetical protein
MAERLVDVMNSNKTVLHTYPITIGAPNIIPNDTEYKAKAMKAGASTPLTIYLAITMADGQRLLVLKKFR